MLHILNFNFSVYLYLLNILITSCSSPSPAEELSTIVIPDRIDSELYLTDLSSSINQIQLETNEYALLGVTKDVKIFNDKFYINDGNQILVFNNNGDFLLKLGNQGGGPGEYGVVYSMDIDFNANLIYVSSGRKLIVFSADHKLIKERNYPMLLRYINVVDKNVLIISDEIASDIENGLTSNTTLYELDPDLNVINNSIVRKIIIDKNKSIGYNFKFYISSDELGNYFFKPFLTPETNFRDTLYKIEGVRLTPYKIIDFEKSKKLNSDGYITPLMLNIVNSSSYIVCEYIQDTERMLFLYEKNTSKYYNLNNGILDHDGIPVILRPLNLMNNTFYYIKQAKYEKGLKEELNPVIGIVKFD